MTTEQHLKNYLEHLECCFKASGKEMYAIKAERAYRDLINYRRSVALAASACKTQDARSEKANIANRESEMQSLCRQFETDTLRSSTRKKSACGHYHKKGYPKRHNYNSGNISRMTVTLFVLQIHPYSE